MFKHNELKLLWPFYSHTFLLCLSKVIMPFYVIYFLNIGLSFFQIALIGSIRSIITIVFEIPTGIVADIFGRKVSVIMGYILSSITLFLLFFAKNFETIILILAFDAIFETLVSGADNAWVVDLLEEKDKEITDRYFIRKRFFRNLGLILSPILASVIIAQLGINYLWPLYAIGTLISAICLFFGQETKQHKSDNITNQERNLGYFFNHFKKSLVIISKNSILLTFFAIIFIFYFADEITGLAWTPLLKDTGISLIIIGYLFSVIAMIGVAMPFFTEWLLRRNSKLNILSWTALFYALLLISVGFINTTFLMVVIFIIFSSAEEIFLPLEEALTNAYIDNRHRATILSMKSVVESGASIVGGPLAGYIFVILSLPQAIMLSGVILLIIPCLYSLIKKGRFTPLPTVN